MEVTEVTQIATAPRRRVRRWLAGAGAPPSLQAQLVLMISALLLGAVLTALLFVGVWRQTAADGARAHAAQVADKQELAATKRTLAAANGELANTRAELTTARLRQSAAATELAQLRQVNRTVGRSLSPQLQAAASTTATLAHDTSALKSEIAGLRAYLTSASPGGVDSGYLDAQVRYLAASSESAGSAVSKLEQQTQAAQVAAARLGKHAK
jgi:predicted  nucleic acid-binding Zn-ribbon protein